MSVPDNTAQERMSEDRLRSLESLSRTHSEARARNRSPHNAAKFRYEVTTALRAERTALNAAEAERDVLREVAEAADALARDLHAANETRVSHGHLAVCATAFTRYDAVKEGR